MVRFLKNKLNFLLDMYLSCPNPFRILRVIPSSTNNQTFDLVIAPLLPPEIYKKATSYRFSGVASVTFWSSKGTLSKVLTSELKDVERFVMKDFVHMQQCGQDGPGCKIKFTVDITSKITVIQH